MKKHTSTKVKRFGTPLIREGYKRKNIKVRWIPLNSLQYSVFNGKRCVIPAGTVGVECSFGTSHLQRYDESKCQWVYMNMYRYNGKVYHA